MDLSPRTAACLVRVYTRLTWALVKDVQVDAHIIALTHATPTAMVAVAIAGRSGVVN